MHQFHSAVMSRSCIEGSLVRPYVGIELPRVGLPTAILRHHSRNSRQFCIQHLPRFIAPAFRNLRSTVETAKQWNVCVAQDATAISSGVPSTRPVRQASGLTDAPAASQDIFRAFVRNKERPAKITPSFDFSCGRKLLLGLGKVAPHVAKDLFAASLGPRADIHLKATAVRVLL